MVLHGKVRTGDQYNYSCTGQVVSQGCCQLDVIACKNQYWHRFHNIDLIHVYGNYWGKALLGERSLETGGGGGSWTVSFAPMSDLFNMDHYII